MQDSNVKDTYFQRKFNIRIGDKLLDLSTPIVMGIINSTPDSFYASSRSASEKQTIEQAEKMLIDGAAIIDIGGYSSRPGAKDITESEEIARIQPLISLLSNRFPDIVISIDTFRANVAQAAIDSGAKIINDISGLREDKQMLDVIKKNKSPYILMHMRGTPQNMQSLTEYDNLFGEMASYFSEKIKILKENGITDIIIDPGFGFSKNVEQNHSILRNLAAFEIFNLPILAGVSRKSMIYKKLNIKPEDALNGTIALHALALNNGANIIRAHDVKEAVEVIQLMK